MTKVTMSKERSIHGSASSGRGRRTEMKEALKLTSYVNRPPYTQVLPCDRISIKCNQTIKVTSQLIDRNKIKWRIDDIEDISKGYGRKGTCRTDSFSHGLRSIS